jgi:hypothetical protein
LTEVLTVTVYVVELACPLVVNTTWLPEQLESAHPPPSIVMVVVLTVVQSRFSLQLIVTLLLSVTPVAVLAGVVESTVGRVLSTVTVLPVAGVSVLLDESVALERIV